MLSSFRGTMFSRIQLQQLRLAHRVRGKAPIYCRTIKERIDELNYKEELYTAKTNIGFPRPKAAEDARKFRTDHLKKIKSDKALEQLARNVQLEVDLNEVRKEWLLNNGPLHKKQVADHYAIFEHLYGEGYFIPYLDLDITYELSNDSSLSVYSGNVIKPAEALKAPTVFYESDGNSLWTLALTSLDGNLTENEKECVHWLVANIPGNAVEKGDTLVEYLQPFPLKGTGYHRYAFVLYKQNGRVSYDVPKVTSSSSPISDRTFVTRDWYQKYQDEVTPIGLAFFQCDWDASVRKFFHTKLQIKDPCFEYDFPAPYIRKQEWFPRRKPFNLYMDKYRDPKEINKEYLLRKLKNEDPFETQKETLKFPNAQPLPKNMPSWLKLHERKIRLGWGRVNDV